jgi:hypothetical protein
MKTIQVTAQVVVPRVPNFLHMADGQILPVEAITEEGLREIGREWTEELIENARKRGLVQ